MPETSNKKYWIAGILIIIAALCVIFIGMPSAKNLKKQTQDARYNQNNLKYGAQYINDINTAYNQYLSYKSLGDILIQANPSRADAASALAQLNAIAANTGLTVTALTPVNTDNGAQVIDANVSGSYEQLKAFLQGVETNVMPFKVKSIAVAAYQNQDGQIQTAGNYEIQLTVASTK